MGIPKCLTLGTSVQCFQIDPLNQDMFPYLSNHLIQPTRIYLAGNTYHGISSCHGDSGGPLMKQIFDGRDRFVQLGVVHGMIAQCGSPKFPSIFARIEDPEIFAFIQDQLCKTYRYTKLFEYPFCATYIKRLGAYAD